MLIPKFTNLLQVTSRNNHIYISDGLELLEVTVSQIAISDHYPVACTLGTERQNGLKGHKSITYRKKITENTDIVNQLVKQQLTRQKRSMI